MSLHLPPLSKLRRLASPVARAADVAVRTWQHSPAEEASSPGAIFLPEELGRITGISAHSNPDFETARLHPRLRRFAPTNICQLEDVVISQGDLFKGPFKRMVFGGPRRFAIRIDDEVDDAGVLCTTWLGWRYFGHWLAEDFADRVHTADLAEASEIEQPQTEHQTAYAAMFGLRRRTVPFSCRIKRLTLVETDLGSRFRVEAWQKMTARINALHPAPSHVGCMLMRGASGQKRVLVNEAEVADFLRARGLRILEPQALALPDLLAQLSGSRLVVGVEGSQLAHGFHCLSEPGAMVVLQPPDRFGLSDKDRCDRKGLRYAFSIGVPEGEGFRIELASLEKVLEKTIHELDHAVRPL
jgi:hypothetical protein